MSLSGIGEAFEFGSKIIDKIFPDKEAAEKAKIELFKLEQNGELLEISSRYNAIIAEAESQDKWTSRARPSFMYVLYIYILAAIPMGILFAVSAETATNVVNGVSAWLEAIPKEMWTTFGIGYVGYSASRSFDKRQILKRGR